MLNYDNINGREAFQEYFGKRYSQKEKNIRRQKIKERNESNKAR